MKKRLRVLLILIAVISFGIALSYPVKYKLEEKSTEETMERLVELRDAGMAKRGAREDGRQRRATVEDAGAEERGKEGAEESEPQAESERSEGTAPSAMEGAPEQEGQAGEQQEGQSGEGSRSEAAEGSEEAEAQPSAEQPSAEQPSEAGQVQPSAEQPGEADQAQPSAEQPDQAGQVQVSQAQPGTEQSGAAQPQVETLPREQTSEQTIAGEEAQDGAGGTLEGIVEGVASAAPTATPEPTPTVAPTRTPAPAPTQDRFERSGAAAYEDLPKRTLDESKILPQFQEIYAENHDFAGWITIPGTAVDYPVVQTDDSDYYLHHDFFGTKNANGQIILDTKCDPYTPSYNLVISGHSMRSGKMFGRLVNYMYEDYWKEHKLVYFDTLMEERTYVVFAAFFSADYDVDETGFRYNADIQYSVDARQWLREVADNELYDTGIDAKFGDEFLTLTTCNKAKRSDGRFVVVCRRLREGEEIE